jgi:hypothetical protein
VACPQIHKLTNKQMLTVEKWANALRVRIVEIFAAPIGRADFREGIEK